MFLWLLFGFLSRLVNCDLQRMIEQSSGVRHLVGLMAFFFLFTLIDGSNHSVGVSSLFVKTFFVYILFIFTTKSKWYFALPVLGLLIYDQISKKIHEDCKKKMKETGMSSEEIDEIDERANKKNKKMNILVVSTIIVGMLHYMYLQKLEYQKDFSLYKFFLVNNTCKSYFPTYTAK